jgi:hypothetical protein
MSRFNPVDDQGIDFDWIKLALNCKYKQFLETTRSEQNDEIVINL